MNWNNFLLFLVVILVTYIPYKGRDFVGITWTQAVALSGWFIIWSTFLINIASPFISFNLLTFAIFSISVFIWFLTPLVVPRFGVRPQTYIKKNPKRSIVRLELRIYFMKFFEILFQQAGFLFIFFAVLKNFSPQSAVLVFTSITFVLHLFNIFVMDTTWSMYYAFLSIPMAFFFGELIYQGLSLVAMSIHLLFYVVSSSWYWRKR